METIIKGALVLLGSLFVGLTVLIFVVAWSVSLVLWILQRLPLPSWP